MRDYSKIVPTFWTGKTGKALRARGSEALIVGMYLLSSPHSNMLGLYYQPVLYMAHETGLGLEGAKKGLQGAIEAGFCAFDEASEMVWVFEMAGYQIASELKASDNRCAGIQKDYDALQDNPFLEQFFDKYQAAFHLSSKRNSGDEIQAPFIAPRKPLPSQEQEQEQEQDTPKGVEGGKPPKPPAFELPDWIPIEPWDEFVAMRRAKGKRAPFTVAAAKGIVIELEKLKEQGHDPEKVLRQSLINGWSGVFPVKTQTAISNEPESFV